MASRNQIQRQSLPGAEAFWNKALEALRPDDREQLLSTRLGPLDSLDGLLSDIRTKRDMAHLKRWRFKRSDGTIIIMRDVFEKILGCVSRYTQSINILANADPIHAGVPWGVCHFLLQVVQYSTLRKSQQHRMLIMHGSGIHVRSGSIWVSQ